VEPFEPGQKWVEVEVDELEGVDLVDQRQVTRGPSAGTASPASATERSADRTMFASGQQSLPNPGG